MPRAARDPNTGLTPKELQAYEHFVAHGSKQAAYLHAYGATGSNGRPRTAVAAEKGAAQVFRRPEVRTWLSENMARTLERVEISAEEANREVIRIAMADPLPDIAEAMETHGGLTAAALRSLPPSVRACIKSITATRDGVRIEFYDKLKALKMLGDRLGIFRKEEAPPMNVQFNIQIGEIPEE